MKYNYLGKNKVVNLNIRYIEFNGLFLSYAEKHRSDI